MLLIIKGESVSSISGFVTTLKNLKVVGIVSALIIAMVFLFQNCGGWDSEFAMIQAPAVPALVYPGVNFISPNPPGGPLGNTFPLQVQCDAAGTYDDPNNPLGVIFVWGNCFSLPAPAQPYTALNGQQGYLLPCPGPNIIANNATAVYTATSTCPNVVVNANQQFPGNPLLPNPPQTTGIWDNSVPNLTIVNPRIHGVTSPIVQIPLDSSSPISGQCTYYANNPSANVITLVVTNTTQNIPISVGNPSCTSNNNYSVNGGVNFPSNIHNDGDMISVTGTQTHPTNGNSTTVTASGLELEAQNINLSITNPIVGQNPIVTTTFSVNGSCESGTGFSPVSFTITDSNGTTITPQPTALCNSGMYTANIPTTNLADGLININAHQSYQNQSPVTAPQSPNVQKYTQPGNVLTIATPTNGQVLTTPTTTVTGNCLPSGNPPLAQMVMLSGPFQGSPIPVPCDANGNYSQPITLTGGDGPKTIVANQNDAMGNPQPTQTVTVDLNTTPINVTIDGPSPNTDLPPGTVTVTGDCTSDSITSGVTVTTSSQPPYVSSPVTCNNGRFTAPGVPIQAGVTNITAQQNRTVGSSTQPIVSNTWTVTTDQTGPSLTLTGPSGVLLTGSSHPITGTCELFPQGSVANTVYLWGNFIGSNGQPLVNNGPNNQNLETATCVANPSVPGTGMFTTQPLLINPNGNGIGASAAWQKDEAGNPTPNAPTLGYNVAPALSLTAGAVGSGPSGNPVVVSGQCAPDGATVSLSGDNNFNSPPSTTCSGGNYAFSNLNLNQGTTQFTVTIADNNNQTLSETTSATVADPIPQSWVTVSRGDNHTCGITYPNHDIYCWGDNSKGQLGIGSYTNQSLNSQSMQKVVQPAGMTGVRWREVSAGEGYTCGIPTSLRSVYCWGKNFGGKMGLGPGQVNETRNTPHKVQGLGDLTNWAPINGSQPEYNNLKTSHGKTCVIADGWPSDQVSWQNARTELWCWGVVYGWNVADPSQAGIADVHDNPVQIKLANGSSLKALRSYDIGGEHGCAVLETGANQNDAYCWGISKNNNMLKGNNNFRYQHATHIDFPSHVSKANGWFNPSEAYVGSSISCYTSNSRSLHCLGSGWMGQLGRPGVHIGGHTDNDKRWVGQGADWDRTYQNMNQRLHTLRQPNGYPYHMDQVAISGTGSVCGIEGGGDTGAKLAARQNYKYHVQCWGNNGSGQVTGSPGGPVAEPNGFVQIGSSNIPAIHLSAGTNGYCSTSFKQAPPAATDAFCWGDNSSGQNGNPNAGDSGVFKLPGPPPAYAP